MSGTNETDHPTITVSNFGPIKRAEIDLKPLTVFVGPSNTGKSYLAVLIYALHCFFSGRAYDLLAGETSTGSPVQKIPENIPKNGSSKRLIGDFLEWFSKETDRLKTLSNHDTDLHYIPAELAVHVRKMFDQLRDLDAGLASELCRCFGVHQVGDLIRQENDQSSCITYRSVPLKSHGKSSDWPTYEFLIDRSNGKVRINTPVPFNLPIELPSIESLVQLMNHEVFSDSEDSDRLLEIVVQRIFLAALSNVLHPLSCRAHFLPSDRSCLMHTHELIVRSLIRIASSGAPYQEGPTGILSGVRSDFLEKLIQLGTSASRHTGNESDLARGLENEILQGTVTVDKSAVAYPSFQYRPKRWQCAKALPLMHTSSMVSEIAPVALYLRYLVGAGEILIIEEPESHLHPQMQVEFFRHLARAVKSGIRIIMTTHSDWIMEELANLVRTSALPMERRGNIEGGDIALDPAEVGAWQFVANSQEGGSDVREIQLGLECGTFPTGFDDVSRSLYNKWAEVSNRIGEVK